MTRMPSFGLPDLPGLPTLGGQIARRAAPRLDISPEDEESIAKKAGRIALGGISAAGNLLGLPGSMVLDTVTGHNPFDQLLHPFSGENRTIGRDALRQWGLAGKKDTWGNFFGGLGVDILTDPLTYLNPFGALTKGGSVVKAAGLLDNVPEIAAKVADVPVGSIGKRVAGMRTKFSDVMSQADPAQLAALQTAATKRGVNLAEIADEPLRGALGLGFFGKTSRALGTGAKSQKMAGTLDTIGETIRYGKIKGTEFSPVDQLAMLFNSKLGQVPGKVGQVFTKKRFAAGERDLAQTRQPLAHFTTRLVKAGWGGEDKADILRSAMEELTPGPAFQQLPPDVQQVVSEARDFKNTIRANIEAEGGVVHEYMSPEVQHWPRQGLADEFTPGTGAGGMGPYDARNQFASPRNPIFSPYKSPDITQPDGSIMRGAEYGIADETTTLRNLVKDAEVNDAIDAFESPEAIAGIIERKYGNKIYRWYQETPGDGTPKDRYKALGEWIANLDPEKRKLGFFANHPIRDLESYAVRGVGQAGSLRAVRDMLLSKGIMHQPGEAAPQVNWKTLQETLQGIEGHVQPEVFGKRMLDDIVAPMNPQQLATYKDEVAQALGQPVGTIDDTAMVQHLLTKRVSEDTATSVGRIMRGTRAQSRRTRSFTRWTSSPTSGRTTRLACGQRSTPATW